MKCDENLKYTQIIPKSEFLKPVIIGVVVIPISLTLWMFTVLSTHYLTDSSGTDSSNPVRWLVAICLPGLITYRGLRKKSLDLSGAFLGYCIGFMLTITSYAFMMCLVVFFLTSSWATKYQSQRKRDLEEDFKEGGQRNWVQVLCNGGIAAYLAVIVFIENGCGERVIDLEFHYRQSWLSLAILCAIACSNGDTWASEFGTVLTDSQPRLITSGQKVPRGTNGGVTLVGVACSATGGLVIGLVYYIVILLSVDKELLRSSPHQWPLIFVGLFGGLFGSLLDSLLGALLQYSGVDEKTGAIVEFPRPGVKRICGSSWLDNHSVNLVSSFLTALSLPTVAHYFWH